MYNTTIAGFLGTIPSVMPCIIFYFMQLSGSVDFVVFPALHLRYPMHDQCNGALFGTATYCTYCIKNVSVLEDWTWFVALVETAGDAVLTFVVSYASVLGSLKVKPETIAKTKTPSCPE